MPEICNSDFSNFLRTFAIPEVLEYANSRLVPLSFFSDAPEKPSVDGQFWGLLLIPLANQ
jgi:hypothetical protein